MLAGCGGGDDSSSSSGSTTGSTGSTGSSTSSITAGGVLTISVATPAANNTTIDTTTAPTLGNDARAADSFSSTLSCDVYAEGAKGAFGVVYAVQVYFRQSDKQPLNVSVVGGMPPDYAVFDNNSGSPITVVTVDATARTVTFDKKVLAGSAGEAGTLSGTFKFPANSTGVAGCGV